MDKIMGSHALSMIETQEFWKFQKSQNLIFGKISKNVNFHLHLRNG